MHINDYFFLVGVLKNGQGINFQSTDNMDLYTYIK